MLNTGCSMEESEALCTRMAVMVNGQFQCLGSNQHIKAKFGEGFNLVIKLRAPRTAGQEAADAKTQALKQHITSTFPSSQLKDHHAGYLHYHIGRTSGLSYAQLFGAVERARSTYDIDDYSVTQASLEQVFIGFARLQREPQMIKSTRCFGLC